jgi:hypothetical protein
MSDPRKIRRIGAGFLLFGSAIVTGASFLSWAQMYVSAPSAAAPTRFNGFAFFQVALGRGDIVAAFILWGLPFWLAVLAVAVLLNRVKGGQEPRINCLFLALIGAFFVCASAWLFLHPFRELANGVRTLDYGLYVALAGYVFAFIGALLLPAIPATAAPMFS